MNYNTDTTGLAMPNKQQLYLVRQMTVNDEIHLTFSETSSHAARQISKEY